MTQRIGILGVGIISSALIRGFCTADCAEMHFYLSPRNAEKAAALATEFPEQITVCSSNQEVVDNADWVFLTLLPAHGEEILTALTFRPEQKILTIMSDHPTAAVQQWVGSTAKLVRMVPLPFAEQHIGPIAIYPADEEVSTMFAPLGSVIQLEKESEISLISGLTGLMSAYFLLVHHVVQWGAEQGLPYKASLDYMTGFFEALSVLARDAKDGDVAKLAYDTTPGGLNEMAYKRLEAKDNFAEWCCALDEIMERLNASAS